MKIALIGCGCSVATEPVAEISHHWNISQVHVILFAVHECTPTDVAMTWKILVLPYTKSVLAP